MKKILLLASFLFATLVAVAQTATLTGKVKDAESGEPLPFCSVFVNNTTISTATDLEGNYTLSGLEPGTLEIGFSFMGYTAETRKVTLKPGGTFTLNLSLNPLEQELSEQEVKASRDKSWERDLRKFQSLFLGIDEAAAQTRILNPWVIDFPEPTEKGSFEAQAELPIELENHYLGYKITFNLKEFVDAPSASRIVGAARFEFLPSASEMQQKQWEKNRADTYRRSAMNLFRSLIKGTQQQEGFYLYGDKPGGSPTMNIRSDIFANELGKSVIPYKADPLVLPGGVPGEYLLQLKGRIEIHYQKGYSQANTYRDAPYPISWVEVKNGQLRVRENGNVLNAEELVFSGDMDLKRVANLLPLDYDAERGILLQDLSASAKNYQEKVYLHTDKPYYYAGDTLFFKGFFAYGNPFLRDQLSKVLHVEVITEERDILIEKKFPIRDGIAVGDFLLPDSLDGEHYFLRAYTNWMRNYGPNQYFMQALPVLNPYKRVVAEEGAMKWANKGVQLLSGNVAFGAREEVNLSLLVTDKNGRPTPANLSIGVWDAEQLVPIRRETDIQNSLILTDISENLGTDRFQYDLETRLSVTGRVTDEKGKGEAAEVTAFVNRFQGLINLNSTAEGYFKMEDMEFYGPLRLGFVAANRKGRPLNVQVIEPLKAPVVLPSSPYFPRVTTLATPVQTPKPAEEGAKNSGQEKQQPKAIYGNPDFVIEGDKLTKTGSSTDLVNSLVGNIPGAQVNLVGGTGQQSIRLRGGATSALTSMEPVVMVDGIVLVGGGLSTAADNIRTINPFDIDRVEVVSRMVPMLGDQGKNGVIAIYLKDSMTEEEVLEGKGIISYTLEGFQLPNDFVARTHSPSTPTLTKDDRQTLYWNPYVVTTNNGASSFSFFSNDLGGPVVVEVRGTTLEGDLIYGTFYLNAPADRQKNK